jgi:hypothetical protein
MVPHLALTALLSSIASKSAESTGSPDAISPEKMQELANQLSDILLDGTDSEANISRDDEVSRAAFEEMDIVDSLHVFSRLRMRTGGL